MRLTRLGLSNWRNFTKVDVELSLRVFVVGPNASGKSNLLDALRFLHDVVAVGGGFRSAVRARNGVPRIRCLSARREPNVAIDVTLGNPDEPSGDVWRYKLVFGQDSKKQPVVKEEAVWKRGDQVLKRPNDDDRSDPERLQQTHLEQLTANRSFRDIAEFFASVRYLHLVPQLLRDPDRAVLRKRDPFGSDLLDQVAGTPKKTRGARLNQIRKALRVAVPQLQKLELWKDEKGVPHLRGLYEHWRPKAGWQTEEQFSDGTLRLFGLLWSVLDGEGPLLLEEPELSLHAEVVRYLPQVFARIQQRKLRQIIISTHSREILENEEIGGEEVLLLSPSAEGTTVTIASSIDQVRRLLEGGVTVADAVIPRTRPSDARQLAMFE